MKLSILIDYYNYLEQLQPETAHQAIFKILDPMVHFVQSHSVNIKPISTELANNKIKVDQSIDQFVQTMQVLKQQLRTMILQQLPDYFERSTELYHDEMSRDTHQVILGRNIRMNHDTSVCVRARISMYGDWQHAAMIVRPSHETLINHLVACTPMYIVDHHQDLLQPLIDQFNPHYQKRLCTYVVTESPGGMLNQLPQNQLGFCLAYNFFNYKPFEVTVMWLRDISKLLMPGGVVGMTFNNCDHAAGVKMSERSYMTFIPGRQLIQAAEKIGYQVKFQHQMDQSNTWIEFAKPGQIESIKGGQTLIEVNHKAKLPVDKSAHTVYTSEHIEKLQNEAIDLNIDTADNIRNSYSPLQLQTLIKQRKNHA